MSEFEWRCVECGGTYYARNELVSGPCCQSVPPVPPEPREKVRFSDDEIESCLKLYEDLLGGWLPVGIIRQQRDDLAELKKERDQYERDFLDTAADVLNLEHDCKEARELAEKYRTLYFNTLNRYEYFKYHKPDVLEWEE